MRELMRIAILSDIHGNLEALKAVLQKVSNEGCDRIVCLGDIVGYGPNPSECLEVMRANSEICVKGNHDEACAASEFPYRFTSAAQKSVMWTREKLSRDQVIWLNKLPFTSSIAGAALAHACFDLPQSWEYLLDSRSVRSSFAKLEGNLGFIGHTHSPIAWILRSDKLAGDECDRVHLDEGVRFIVNVGSVGQPRDRDSHACFALWDTERNYIDFKRVVYDWNATATKIRAAGLPESLANRLSLGM